MVEVIDSGVGIREEDQVNLFTNFHKVKLNRNLNNLGVGLGLSISKCLIDSLEG